MKKFIALFYPVLISLHSLGFGTKNVNEKVLQIFKESFPTAKQVIWTESKESYTVYFLEDSVRTRITYDKEGAFMEAFRYYQEKNLPYYLLATLKRKFPEKKIFGITEVSTLDEIVYYVKLEDSSVWLTVKLDSEGHLAFVERFKKAS
jgi:hypothetical protein